MFRKQHPEAGARPGTLIVPPDAQPTRIRVTTITLDHVDDQRDVAAREVAPTTREGVVTWVSVQGFADLDALLALAEQFEIHPLVLEDLVNLPQRPKHEVYEKHAVVIAQGASIDPSIKPADCQVSMVVGHTFVITFEQSHSSLFRPVRDRLSRPGARLRSYGASYLAYALFDTIVDSFYPIIADYGERLERLEDQVLHSPHPNQLSELNALKRQLVELRWSCWAQRDTVTSILHDEDRFGLENIRIFLRDTLDHCTQIAEVLDMYRETLSGLLHFYLSSVGQRTNEIMKTLTIMASIFIPLTFLAGIYGMNFEHMPELDSQWGYPFVWITMGVIVVIMLAYFRHKGWIGGASWGPSKPEPDAGTSPVRAVAIDYQERRAEPVRRAA